MSTTDFEFAPLAVNQPFSDFADVADPAAGAVASYKAPGEYSVAVVAARAVLTTDANVANRYVSLDYIDGRGVTRVRNAAGLVVTASTTGLAFEWNAGRTVSEWAANTPVLIPCLDVLLPPATVFQITVDNIQVGDQLTGVHLLLVKVETGPDRRQQRGTLARALHR